MRSKRSKDPIVEQVVDKMRQRSEVGLKKYGTTLQDNDLTLEEWLNHATEEAMDLCLYLTRIQAKIKERRNKILEDIMKQDQENAIFT